MHPELAPVYSNTPLRHLWVGDVDEDGLAVTLCGRHMEHLVVFDPFADCVVCISMDLALV